MSIYDCLTPFELRGVEGQQGADYCTKMMHALPPAPVVDRVPYIMDKCKGKRVLNLGSESGTLHEKIGRVAMELYGVDKVSTADFVLDLDDSPALSGTYDLVVAGEILEHLANPGGCLKAIRPLGCPLLITAPNAFSSIGTYWIQRGYEQVNTDHVSYYSYWTLKTLVERYGFTVQELAWYNGQPRISEGLIMLVN